MYYYYMPIYFFISVNMLEIGGYIKYTLLKKHTLV
jgi:hypothetical protein